MSQKDKHDCMQCERKKETILTLHQQNMEMNTALGDEQFKKKRILLAEKQQRVQLQAQNGSFERTTNASEGRIPYIGKR